MDHFPIITKEIQTNFEACVKKNVEPTLDYGLHFPLSAVGELYNFG